MNCAQIKNLLIPFLQSELSEGDRAVVKTHLQKCDDCRREKVLLEKSWVLMDGFQVPKVSGHFTKNVMAKIHAQEEEKPKFTFAFPEINIQFGFRVLAPAMISVCVLIVVYLLVQNQLAPKQQIAKEILPEQKTMVEVAQVTPAEQIENTQTAVVQVAKVGQEPSVAEVVPVEQKEEVTIVTTELAKNEEAKTVVADEEIIRHLDVYENAELYKNYALVSDLDVVESLDEKVL